MADISTPVVSSEPSTPSTPPSSAADQARLRKERREAKIRAGGSSRLNKISGLGGGLKRDAPEPAHADPDEVDISQHFYEPAATRRPKSSGAPSDDALRQMMLGNDFAPPPGQNPFGGFPGMSGMPGMDGGAPGGEDPMMKLMQQMMGGMPGEGPNGMPSFPGMPDLAGMGQAPPAEPYAYIWRIIHALFALSLGFYIAFTRSFTGTKIARLSSQTMSAEGLAPASIHFFYIFATAEVVLQTTRFFLEKGKPSQAGVMGMVIGFLPEPYKGYLALLSRYLRIWTTVSGDAMVLVFILGVCAWWQG